MNKIKQIDNYINSKELDLDRIIDDFTPYVKTIINNMTNNNLSYEDKEEILADTFFVLWKNRHNYINSLDSYIAGITRNLVKEKFKKRKITYDISDYENIIGFNDVELFSERRNIIEIVNKSLKNLNELDIKIISMFYYSSKSTKDIAKELNLSEINVRTKLFRIRKKIKKELHIGGLYER